MFVDREIVQIEVMRIRSIRMYNVCFSNRPRDAHVGGAVGGPNACGRAKVTCFGYAGPPYTLPTSVATLDTYINKRIYVMLIHVQLGLPEHV